MVAPPMASASAASLDKSTFLVQLLKLRNFPPEAQRIDCFATVSLHKKNYIRFCTERWATAWLNAARWRVCPPVARDGAWGAA